MSDYQRIAAAIQFLCERHLEQPSLDEVATQIELSPFHFQRLFKRYAGVSPKRFLQHLTTKYAKELLRQSTPVLETSFAVGLSSPGRLYDLLISVEAVTPGEFKSGGAGIEINYGFHSTPFGECLIGLTTRGICRLEFCDTETTATNLHCLEDAWPEAQLTENQITTGAIIERIFSPRPQKNHSPLSLLLRGTNFQLKVWQALLRIPEGSLTSYGYLAEKLKHPGASRAVGTAIGKNPIGYLIPCHRVLRGNGEVGGYRWGIERKLTILGTELTEKDTASIPSE